MIVIGYVPPAAVEAAVNVTVLAPAVGLGENEAVRPLGRPEAASFTLPVNPYSGLTVIDEVAEAPRGICRLFGELPITKEGKCTATLIFVVAVSLPEVPVIVTIVEDAAAVALAFNVSTLLPVVGFVPQLAVTPAGNAEIIASATLPLKSAASVMLIVVVVVPPCVRETVGTEAAIQNPGTCLPARSSIRLCPVALPHPVTRS